MIKSLMQEIKKSSISVLPIYALIVLLALTKVLHFTSLELLSFSFATFFVIIGIALFNYGAERSMTPIGNIIGRGLTKQGKVWLLLLVVFLFGFFITVTEPDLSVLAIQTESIFNRYVLILCVAFSVGLFLLLGVLKIIKKTNLVKILCVCYLLAFSLISLLVLQEKELLVALCFDSGGVTTGPMTVPFLMALGAGIASVLSKKSEKDAAFGFVALSSIGPIIVLLLLSLFSKNNLDYSLADYSIPQNFFPSFGYYLLEKLKSVGLSIGLLFVSFFLTNILILKLEKKQFIKLSLALLYSFLGLVLFLSSVDATYIGIGYKIGLELNQLPLFAILLIAFVIGALTVLAEPAIRILTTQVEVITNGLIKKNYILSALAVGVGISITLALLRIKLNFSILYILIPGYVLCFVLSFFIPNIYTVIAFDAGGVASGPLTSSFILPIALGLTSSAFGPDSILSLGFGVVSLVALSPLLSIEVLGFILKRRQTRHIQKEYKEIVKENDKILISFLGD